jgi:hypothetical protein
MVKETFIKYFEEYFNRAQKIKKILARNQGILEQYSEDDELLARLANLRPPFEEYNKEEQYSEDYELERRLAMLRGPGMQFSLVGATTCGLGRGMSNAMVTNALHFGPLLARLHVASLTIYIYNALITR